MSMVSSYVREVGLLVGVDVVLDVLAHLVDALGRQDAVVQEPRDLLEARDVPLWRRTLASRASTSARCFFAPRPAEGADVGLGRVDLRAGAVRRVAEPGARAPPGRLVRVDARPRARPSFEYGLVLVSFSQTLNCSIFVSMSFRAVASARLSLTCAEDNRGSGARNVTEIARVAARRRRSTPPTS